MKVNKISFSTEDIKVKIYYNLIFAYILIVEINKDDFLEFSIWNKNLDKNKINIEKNHIFALKAVHQTSKLIHTILAKLSL